MRRCFSGLLALFMLGAMVNVGWGQVNISAGSTVTEDFSIGTSKTAALPTGWRADKNTTIRAVGSYSSAVTATEQIAGNNMSSSATNGVYNYAAGDQATVTDRAVGGLSSSSASKSVNIYVQLYNNGENQIDYFTISYSVEKYRNGSNTAGFSIQTYYSTDGVNWTSAGSDFLTSFTADADNSGYASAPGATVTVSSKTLNQSLAKGNSLYLAWNYSVTSGTTTSNAQALGIDDVSITANIAGSPTITVSSSTLSGFSYVVGSGPSSSQSYNLSGANLSPSSGNLTVTGSTNYEVSTDNSTFSSSTTVAYSSNTLDATTIYVRLKSGLSAGSYNSETVTNSGGGASDVPVTCSGTVYKTEPSNHVTGFTATKDGTYGYSRIDLSWTENDGSVIPDGYLIKASIADNITDPSDGTAVSDNTTIGSNSGAINITYGTNSYEWTGLTAEQTYYFKIYPYTNSSTNINYKTDATVPNANATTDATPSAPNVFFSEYIEGSSNNKALEIYNATGSSISLNLFTVKLYTNGSSTASYTFAFDSNPTLANNDVYVIYNSNASTSISSVGDATSTVTYFNGDDAIGLYYGDLLIDVIGVIGVDPGTAWDVADTTGATLDHTLVRKQSITSGNTSWTTSAGTNADDSEWIVYTTDTFNYLGSHTSDASLPVSLTSFTAMAPSGTVFLSWRTESETENLGFIIERRSMENGGWEEIASYTTTDALAGHGSTPEAHEYYYLDEAVVPGVTYAYRLGDVDYAGKVTWHKELAGKVS